MNTVFLERICRCCLNESECMSSLFDRVGGIEPFTFEPHFTYSDLIYLCTNVRCDLDVIDANEHIVELPRNVCESCLQELRAAFLFRQKCESSDNLLREQTVGLSSQHITEEIIEFDQTTDGKKINKSFTVEKIDKVLPNEECVFIDNEKQLLITVNEQSSLQRQSNEIEVQIVSVADNLPFVPEQQTTENISAFNNSCKICEEEFHSELHLQAHNRQQHPDKKYKCPACAKEFHTEKGLLAHSNSHNGETRNQKFLCSICGKFFATKQRLKEHASTHSGEKNHACDECGKKFSTESRLRCHKRIHTGEKPFRCEQCSLSFAQGNALRCHKRIHTGEKPYECKFCFKRFSQNTILKTHMTLHTGKTIKCPDCDKMFSRASNLILHRREHTGEKPYGCTRCPNRYKQKSHLDRHMDTHLGVKHKCEICKKVYSKRWSLKVHMFTHSKIKPHRCTICDAEFARRDKFKNHLKSIHGLILSDNNPTSSSFTFDNTNEEVS